MSCFRERSRDERAARRRRTVGFKTLPQWLLTELPHHDGVIA
jgi:hypothetical protein